MESSLIDTIFLSEKRKNLLLLLLDGPKSSDEIKEALDVSWRAMIPQIKKLKENDLVIQENKIYSLSSVGKLVVENMRPLLDTLKVVELDNNYWVNRDLSTVPEGLSKRIGELGDCILVEPDLDHLFELPAEFTVHIKGSKNVLICASYFHPAYPGLYSELVDNGVELSIVMTESVLERFKQDCMDELKKMLGSKKVHLYVCDEGIKPPTVIITDEALLLSFFNISGKYDHKDIVSSDPGALEWGKELFQYYREISRQLSEV